jgi:hypothetical protein
MREKTATEKMMEEYLNPQSNAVFPDIDRYISTDNTISLNNAGFQDYCCRLFRAGGMSVDDFIMLAKQQGWWKATTAEDRDDAIKSALEFLKNHPQSETKEEKNEPDDDYVDDLDDMIASAKNPKLPSIKPLFPNHFKYPTSASFSPPPKPSGVSITGSWAPQYNSLFGGGNATNEVAKPDVVPDVPKENLFELPLWIGRHKEGAMMQLLKKIYEGHGEKPYNGVLVMESAFREWLTLFAEDNRKFYVTLGGMSDYPPTDEISYDPTVLTWDIPCKLHSIEFFDKMKDEKHGTPLRVVFSIECRKDYMVAKELHKNGRFYLRGDCETEFDDIVKFRIRGLCFVEWRDTEDFQVLMDNEPIDDVPF